MDDDKPANRPYQTYRSRLDRRWARVSGEGRRASIALGDLAIGPFAGELRFTLHGKKLHGGWVLVRTGGRRWLLIKRKDDAASKTVDVATEKPRSVVSRRLLAGIARDEGGDVARAATGDP